jgi:hypothetical protein
MFVNCPKCSAYVRAQSLSTTVQCAVCGCGFSPSPLQRRRAARQEHALHMREELAPVDLAGSLLIFLGTVVVLLASYGLVRPGGLLVSVHTYLVPFWVTLLTLATWMTRHFDRGRTLVLIPRTSIAVLIVMALPVLLAFLPR